MDDKTMLGLAARAAGAYWFGCYRCWYMGDNPWRPLTDDGDALAEGVSWCDRMEGFHIEAGSYFHAASAVESFRGLWESINGPGSWSADPWAWAVSFRLR